MILVGCVCTFYVLRYYTYAWDTPLKRLRRNGSHREKTKVEFKLFLPLTGLGAMHTLVEWDNYLTGNIQTRGDEELQKDGRLYIAAQCDR